VTVGLFSGLLTLPLAPVRGTVWVAEQVLEQAERDHYDPGRIRRQLEEIDRARAEGSISQDDATAAEEELVQRLMDGRNRTARGKG